jgi:dihydrofolate reductase
VTTRKLVLQLQYSLDGCVAGPNGELDWIFPDFDAEYANWGVEKLWQAGAHLMGSATYKAMAAHWPTSSEPYAPPMNEIPKIVFSRSLSSADWRDTRIVSTDLATEIRKLKHEPGRDLLAHGGVRFARSLIRSGLVDEFRLIVHPVALGDGLRPFSDLAAPIRLRLATVTTFKTGIVAKEFQPAGNP